MSVAHDAADPGAAACAQLEQRAKAGATWFYWIAGVTLLNSLLSAFGSDWNFIFGLGIGLVCDAVGNGLAAEGGRGFVAVGLGASVLALSTYVLWGWLACRGRTLGFALGMTFYALDTLIFLAAADWLGAAFHVFALFMIGRGFRAHRELQRPPRPAPASPKPATADSGTDADRAAVEEIIEAVAEENREQVT